MALTFVFWFAAIVVKATAACRMLRNGLILRFPLIWAYLLGSTIQSIALIMLRHSPGRYAAVYAATAPLVLMLEGLAVIGVFWSLTEHYLNFQTIGSIILGTLMTVGGVLAGSTRATAVPGDWAGAWQTALLYQRYATLVLIIGLFGGWILLPRLKEIPVRKSAQRAAIVIGLQVSIHFGSAAYTILAGSSYLALAIGGLIPVMGGFAVSLLWALWLTPASDQCAEPIHMSVNDYRRIIADGDAWWQDFERMARKMLGRD